MGAFLKETILTLTPLFYSTDQDPIKESFLNSLKVTKRVKGLLVSLSLVWTFYCKLKIYLQALLIYLSGIIAQKRGALLFLGLGLFIKVSANAASIASPIASLSASLEEMKAAQSVFQSHVMSTLEAHPDVITPAKAVIGRYDQDFGDRIGPREKMIRRDDQVRMDFIHHRTSDHSLLKPLQKLIRDLQRFGEERELKAEERQILDDLRAHYHTYERQLVEEGASHLFQPLIRVGAQDREIQVIDLKKAQGVILKDIHGRSLREEGQVGNHTVSSLAGVHFKVNGFPPLMPGFEIALYGFHERCFGGGLIPSTLLVMKHVPLKKFDRKTLDQNKKALEERLRGILREEGVGDFEATLRKRLEESLRQDPTTRDQYRAWTLYAPFQGREEEFFEDYPAYERFFKETTEDYVVQASRTVSGKRLDLFLRDITRGEDTLERVDLKQYSLLFLGSLLTRPGDGKGDNYMIDEEGRIIGIDNDEAFKPVITRGGNRYYMGVRTVLWSLSTLMNKSVNEEVRHAFLEESPALILWDWVMFLNHQNDSYQSLGLSRTEQDELNLPIQFKHGTLRRLYGDIITLQDLLRGGPLTHDALLESFYGPTIIGFYKEAGNAEEDYEGVFRKIYNAPLESAGQREQLEALLEYERSLSSPESPGLESPGSISPSPVSPRLVPGLESPSLREGHQSLEDGMVQLFPELDLGREPILEVLERFVPLMRGYEGDHHVSWREEGIMARMIGERANPAVVGYLIKLGHSLSWREEGTGHSLLHKIFLDEAPLIEHAELIVGQNPLLLNQKNSRGDTPLDVVMERKDTRSFRWLIQKGGGETFNLSLAVSFYDYLRRGYVPSGGEEGRTLSISPPFAGAGQDISALRDHRGEPSSLLENPLSLFKTLEQNQPELKWRLALYHILPSERYRIEPSSPAAGFVSPYFEGAHFGGCTLREGVYGDLIDERGEIKRVNTYGQHPVARATKEDYSLYFKFMPELPGIESAVSSLTRSVLGWGTPYTDLFIMKGRVLFEGKSIVNPPVLVSLGIEGENFKDAILRDEGDVLSKLDRDKTQEMILMSFLVNPEDGKPDNYILEPFKGRDGTEKIRPVSVDNDRSFVPAIARVPTRGRDGTKCYIQVKTVLYILPQMLETISDPVKAKFLEGFGLDTLEGWVTKMWEEHNLQVGLVGDDWAEALFREHEAFMGVPFRPHSMSHLYTKMRRLKTLLRGDTITPLEILKWLEPTLADRYERFIRAPLSLQEKFKRADGDFYGLGGETLSQSGMILSSFKIEDRKEVRDHIRTGIHFTPFQALEELKMIAEEEGAKTLGSIEGIRTDHQAEEFLEGLDLRDIPQSTIKGLIGELKRFDLRRLYLRNTPSLKLNLLLPLTLEKIVILHLGGSTLSGANTFLVEGLSKGMPHLKELYLPKVKGIKKFYESPFVGADKPLILLDLTRLNLSGMDALEEIWIDAPNLRWMNLRDNSRLRSLRGFMPSLAECYMANTALTLENYLSCLGLLFDGMDRFQYKVTLEGLKDLDFEELPKVIKRASVFMNTTQSAWEKDSILSAVRSIQDRDWTRVRGYIQETLKDLEEMKPVTGWERAALIRALKDISEETWPWVLEQMDRLRYEGMDGTEHSMVMRALKDIKEEERDSVMTLLPTLITPSMDGGDIAAVMEKIQEIPREQREGVQEIIVSLIQDRRGSDHEPSMDRWMIEELIDKALELIKARETGEEEILRDPSFREDLIKTLNEIIEERHHERTSFVD